MEISDPKFHVGHQVTWINPTGRKVYCKIIYRFYHPDEPIGWFYSNDLEKGFFCENTYEHL